MKHSTEIFELFMFQARDNRLEASEQNSRTIILFKYYYVLMRVVIKRRGLGIFPGY